MTLSERSKSPAQAARPAGNRERVIEATIGLMNQKGCEVGTSQIAEHCDISPGNLYYHFRNREGILREIFARLEADLDAVLTTRPSELISPDRLAGYYTQGAEVLWRYRFIFASATEFIDRDPAFAQAYHGFSQRSIGYIQTIIATVTNQHPGPLMMTPAACREAAENKWILWIGWPRYAELSAGDTPISEANFARGLEQIFGLLVPYLEHEFCKHTANAIHNFVVALNNDLIKTASMQ